MLRLVFLLCGLCMVAPVWAGDVKPMAPADFNALLNYLEKELSPIKSLSADFEQEKHIALFDEVIKGKGRLLFQKPHDIRFEITSPFKSVLIVSGKHVGKYEQVDGKWQRLRLPNKDALALVMNQIADWMQGKFREQSHLFALSGEWHGDQRVLVLTPKPKRFAELIARIEIALVKGKASFASIIIREPDGDHTVLRFTAEKRDLPLVPALFETLRAEPAMPDEAKSK